MLTQHKMDYISDLPDCVLSYILSMLSIKDLLKTTILSRRWCKCNKLWALRRDLNFDVNNVLGSHKELLEAGYLYDVLQNSTVVKYLDTDRSRIVFVKRVDQFVKNFQGAKIDSFVVNFFLNGRQSRIIDQWIRFAIAMRVERIELLLLGRPYPYARSNVLRKRYKFPIGLFLESNASTLKHMHLQRCLVCFDVIPFTNLRSLTLTDTTVDEIFITNLLSNCLLLEELSLMSCDFKSSMLKIVSSSLCHLEVAGCFVLPNRTSKNMVNLSSLDCLKLTSFRYSGHNLETMSINAPVLKSIRWSIFFYEIPNEFTLFATLPQLETLHLDTYLRDTTSLMIVNPLKHLKQLNFLLDCDFHLAVEFDVLWILTILQACPLLQKLSVMVTYPKFLENQKDIKDLELFSHNEVNVIEMGGCVGNWYEIEFAMNVLKNAHKLERLVMSPYWREHESFDWNSDPIWFQNGRERVLEKLQGEIVLWPAKLMLI